MDQTLKSSETEQNVFCASESGHIKKEAEVTVKQEPLECVVCLGAVRRDGLELAARTPAGTCLRVFLARYSAAGLAPLEAARRVCRACADLIALLEQAELDYNKIRDTFRELLGKNPLFSDASPLLGAVKHEPEHAPPPGPDSEDEPLARTKRKHSSKGVKKKKKTITNKKRKSSSSLNVYEWDCNECGAHGSDGGTVALAAHKLTLHSLSEEVDIKTEEAGDGGRSQSPYNNGLDTCSEVAFGDFDDDDEDSTFNPEDFFADEPKKKKMKQQDRKTWHPCGQCNARFSSMARLEHHRQKHDGSKPPYICEVCGAHYKHKRACDIHIALHKGISDWKCEECNKLFPSKNALQRHNNIHTGKLNYQCDLCGKSFIHTSSFKMHKLSHSGVKPHACDVCGLALMTRSHLKRHKRIHSGEKRHECNVCGKRFSERYNLAAHGKSHETPPSAAGAGAPVAPRRRLFRCHFCTERFERRYMLERHMSQLHGRTLERPPPTPRNTMSKLLKAQAQARHVAPPTAPAPPTDDKEARSPPQTQTAPAPSKLLAQLTSSSLLAPVSWSGAYAAEFGLRDYPH